MAKKDTKSQTPLAAYWNGFESIIGEYVGGLAQGAARLKLRNALRTAIDRATAVAAASSDDLLLQYEQGRLDCVRAVDSRLTEGQSIDVIEAGLRQEVAEGRAKMAPAPDAPVDVIEQVL